jgi:hypothetical protein
VAKHIQLPAVGAVRGIIIRAFVILIKVHYKQERTHNITIDDGIAFWLGGRLFGNTIHYW